MTTDLIQEYQRFYSDNKAHHLSFYGLIPLGEKGSSKFHIKPYSETLEIDFPFTEACIWEDFEDEDEVIKTLDLVQYGNITIAKEGCETYWILIVSGKHKGEVWLLTELGITPMTEPLTLLGWKAKQLESNNTFWHTSLKNWGPVEYAYFYAHAPKKMATAGENVFGVATSMCQDCLIFISKAAISNEKDYVVTDCEGTRRFQKDGSIEFAEG